MDMMITKKNGDATALEDIGVHVKDFLVSSIPLGSVYGTIEGRHGTVDYGATYLPRNIRVPFYIESPDLISFPQKRDALYALLVDVESYYIKERRREKARNYGFTKTDEPSEEADGTGNQSVDGKSYLVRLQNAIDLEQMLTIGEGELVYETTELPFGESAVLSRSFTGTSFQVINSGNVPIHPFLQHLKIKISNATGSLSYLELENTTNGNLFRVDAAVTSARVILLDGPVVTRDGLQYLRSTNRQFIQLEPGRNDFVLRGVFTADVEFEFKEYFK